MTVKVIVRKPWDDGFRTYAKGDVVSVIDGEKITGISTEGRHIKISFTNGLSEFYKRAYVDIVINNMEGDRGEEI